MSKMLMVLGLSIIFANAQTPQIVKGCGEKPEGSTSTSVFIEHNNHVGVFISPKHFLLTHKSFRFTKNECEKSNDFTELVQKFTKATFIGTCGDNIHAHGFLLVEDDKLNADWFACLPTERVAENTNLEFKMPATDALKPVTVVPCEAKDIGELQKICLTPPEQTLEKNGNPVFEKQGDHYTLHGIGVWVHKNKMGEMVSVHHHLDTICGLVGPSFCEPPTTIAPTTTEPPTEAPTPQSTSADTSPSPTTTEPTVSVTDPSPTAPQPSPTPAATPAPTQTSEKKTKPLKTSKKKKKTSKAPEVHGPEAERDILEDCNDKFLCFDEDELNSAGGNGILMAIGMILVMVLF